MDWRGRFDYGGLELSRVNERERPRSALECFNALKRAAKTVRPVVPVGSGHTGGGQTLARGGVSLDTTGLMRSATVVNGVLRVGAGVRWSAVLAEIGPLGLMPPVVTSALDASVGGTLVCGGIGETSFRAGLQVSHLTGATWVTPEGIHESALEEARSFELFLADVRKGAVLIEASIQLRELPEHTVGLAVRTTSASRCGEMMWNAVELDGVLAIGVQSLRTAKMDRGLWNLSMVVDNSLSAVSTVSAHLGGYVPVITKTQAGLYGGLSVPSGGPAWSREWMRLGLHCLVPRSVEIDCMKALHSPFDLVPDALIEGYMVPVKVDPRSATVIGFREDTMTVAVGCCAVVPRALKLGLLERSAQAYAAVREAGGVVYGIGYVDETAGVGFHVPPAL